MPIELVVFVKLDVDMFQLFVAKVLWKWPVSKRDIMSKRWRADSSNKASYEYFADKDRTMVSKIRSNNVVDLHVISRTIAVNIGILRAMTSMIMTKRGRLNNPEGKHGLIDCSSANVLYIYQKCGAITFAGEYHEQNVYCYTNDMSNGIHCVSFFTTSPHPFPTPHLLF